MKLGIGVLVLGILLLLGSCVPFGTAIYRSLHAHPAASVELNAQGSARTGPLSLDTSERVQIALRLDIATSTAHHNTSDNAMHTWEGRYRFPLDYRVLDAAGRVLHAEHAMMDWQQGARSYGRYDVDRDGGWLTVETGFDKFTLAHRGPVRVEVHLGRDTTYGAHVQAGRLIVYDRVYRHTRPILLGIGLAVLGLVVTVVGVILLVVRSVGTAGQTATAAAGPPGAAREPGAPAARNWAMWCHLSALGGYFVPLGGLIAPLVLWLVGRERDPFIDEQGKEAVNFRLTLLLYYLVGFLLIFVIIGFFLLAAVALFDLVLTIVAGVRASSGEHFRYPLTLRMVR